MAQIEATYMGEDPEPIFPVTSVVVGDVTLRRGEAAQVDSEQLAFVRRTYPQLVFQDKAEKAKADKAEKAKHDATPHDAGKE